jgi:hypothetical protein
MGMHLTWKIPHFGVGSHFGRCLTTFALDKDLAPNARGYSTWILNTYFFILGMVFKLVFTTKVRAPLA